MSRRRELLLVAGLFLVTLAVSAAFWAVLPTEYRENQSTDYLHAYEPVARAIAAGRGITLDGEIVRSSGAMTGSSTGQDVGSSVSDSPTQRRRKPLTSKISFT